MAGLAKRASANNQKALLGAFFQLYLRIMLVFRAGFEDCRDHHNPTLPRLFLLAILMALGHNHV
ncbi:hypothetical protein Nwat_0319 [Nitrosococcus watsonii C-113]|uniref:Uncharacterized protein n=1 Tax=Nitrosococcus watsoni (strain C-113) TaxID=105559 RepID=D8K9K0_NITWC|nr:hypothetical protein Nwat_0319 [Nitrosococcus watsonii C-113]